MGRFELSSAPARGNGTEKVGGEKSAVPGYPSQGSAWPERRPGRAGYLERAVSRMKS